MQKTLMVSGDHHPKIAPIIRIKFDAPVLIIFGFSGGVSLVLSGGGVSMVLGGVLKCLVCD